MLMSYHAYIYIDEQTEKSYTGYVTIAVLRQAGYIWALRKELIVFISILPCYYYELALKEFYRNTWSLNRNYL